MKRKGVTCQQECIEMIMILIMLHAHVLRKFRYGLGNATS